MPLKKNAAMILLSLASAVALAHNQSPATIRKSMTKAFASLEAPAPSNVFKGNATARVSGSTAQVFDVKKDDKLIGKVAQIEVQEQTYAVAVDLASGQVKAVVREGSGLSEAEWKDLPFVDVLRKTLAGK
ncbi:MAG: hypothetical protein ABIR96_08705 [Bdellovibrionota bacterium]